MSEDFSGLKAGDKVVVFSGIGGRADILVVDRITTTQIVVNGSRRFRKETGYECGSDFRWRARISISKHSFLKAMSQLAESLLRKTFPFTADGVMQARKAADYAEAVLRELGKWE